jgi:hypothetical protein
MKLRTTPNAWQAVLAVVQAHEDEGLQVRAWLETQAEVHPTVVNLDVNQFAPFAKRAADAIRKGSFSGRTKGAVQKIVEALDPSGQAQPVQPTEPVEAQPTGLDLLPPTLPGKTWPEAPTFPEKPAEAQVEVQPEAEPATQATKVADAELDLILNPFKSIRDEMAALAVKLKE